MRDVLLLLRLQWMQSFAELRGSAEGKRGTIRMFAVFGVFGGLVFSAIAWLGWMAYVALGDSGMAKTVFNLLFFSSGMLTFTFALPSVLRTFFGSSDIEDLLPLPISPFAVAFAKALNSLAPSYLWTFLMVAAPLFGWGIGAGAELHYWVTYVLAVALAPLMPTAYAGMLSIVFASAFKRVRRKDVITTITTVVSFATSLLVYLISSQGRFHDNAAQMMENVAAPTSSVLGVFPAYGFAVNALMEADSSDATLFALLSLVAFAVFVAVARFLYLRIVTSLSSGGAKAKAFDDDDVMVQSSALKALVVTEIRRVVRNSSVLMHYVVYPLVVMPVMFFVGRRSLTLTGLADKYADSGNITSAAAGMGIAFMVMVAINGCLNNKTTATCISREGSNWIHMKFIPVPMKTQILAKTLAGYVFSVAIVVLTAGVGAYLLVSVVGIDMLVVAWGVLLALGAAWLMACIGTWGDSCKPHVDWGNDGDVDPQALKGNAGTLRASLVGLLYTALPLLTTPFVGLEPRVFMPVIAVGGVAAAVLFGRLLLAAAARNLESFN